jgi:hypothetical protein
MDIQPCILEIIFTGFKAIPEKVVYSLPKCLVYHLYERVSFKMDPLIEDLVMWVKKARYQDRNLDWTEVRFRLCNNDQSIYKTFSITSTTDNKKSYAFYTELPCTLTKSFENIEKRSISENVSSLTKMCIEHLTYDERIYIATNMHFGHNLFKGVAWNVL